MFLCRHAADTALSLQRVILEKDKIAYCKDAAWIFVDLKKLQCVCIDRFYMWECSYLAIVAPASVMPREGSLLLLGIFPVAGAKSAVSNTMSEFSVGKVTATVQNWRMEKKTFRATTPGVSAKKLKKPCGFPVKTKAFLSENHEMQVVLVL